MGWSGKPRVHNFIYSFALNIIIYNVPAILMEHVELVRHLQ